MPARQEIFAAMLGTPGMCWGEEEQNAQPARFSGTRDDKAIRHTTYFFPESAGDCYRTYRHDARDGMIRWTSTVLASAKYTDEQSAFCVCADEATGQVSRLLNANETMLLNSVVRDVFSVLEAQRHYSPRRLFR